MGGSYHAQRGVGALRAACSRKSGGLRGIRSRDGAECREGTADCGRRPLTLRQPCGRPEPTRPTAPASLGCAAEVFDGVPSVHDAKAGSRARVLRDRTLHALDEYERYETYGSANCDSVSQPGKLMCETGQPSLVKVYCVP